MMVERERVEEEERVSFKERVRQQRPERGWEKRKRQKGGNVSLHKLQQC